MEPKRMSFDGPFLEFLVLLLKIGRGRLEVVAKRDDLHDAVV